MFRPTRRPERALGEDETWAVLESAEYGVLAMQGVEGYPYAVPMNHVIIDSALYFHAAVSGHRLEALRANPHVCFTVTLGPEEAEGDIPPDSIGTYSSVVMFGTVEEMPPEQRMDALIALCRRYAPGRLDNEGYFARYIDKVSILRMQVDHITGKRLLVT